MNLDVDPARVLYAVGVLFGVAAVLYFARDIVFELSITVRAVLLLLGFVVLLVAALTAERTAPVVASAVLAAAAYLAFVWYVLSRFDVGADGTFFALLVSAVLFLGLGFLVREWDLSFTRRIATFVLVGVLLVAVAMVGADAAASGVDYEVQIDDEATVEGGEVTFGTLTVENRFVFREPIDAPEVDACLAVPELEEQEVRPVPVVNRVGDGRLPDTVPGSGTIEARLTARLSTDVIEAIDGPIPVTRADECPESSEETQLVVIEGGGSVGPPLPPR